MEGRSKSLYREQYDALGKRNLPTGRQRNISEALRVQSPASVRRVFLSDFTDSRELLDVSD
jgi:hypothetical protein